MEIENILKNVSLVDGAKENFKSLLDKFLSGPATIDDWNAVQPPTAESLLLYESLPEPSPENARRDLARLAVCKLNGGLGTTMGCEQPKSTLIVREGKSFLDLIVEQLRDIQRVWGVDVPMILMNSFYTSKATAQALKRYGNALSVYSFEQNRFPRLLADSLLPVDEKKFGVEAWYPPGHGDFYNCIQQQGLLDTLLADGKEIVFLSNADNLGAVVDVKILHHMLENDVPFLMEMTEKTPADVKGGTIYRSGNQLKLLEIAHVPEQHIAEFCGQDKFKVFNTNNIWINLNHLRRMQALDLGVIVNRKTIRGQDVIQLESAVGSALACFEGAQGLTVPRKRFLPVKKTDDLLLVQSDLFELEHGRLERNPKRKSPKLPLVQLGEKFTHIAEYQKRFPAPPSLLDLESLKISGDVSFEGSSILRGHVCLAGDKNPLIVPDGKILGNQTVES
jgi:UTP--glucose-1-phosphate uridylyltransferase